MLFQFLTRSMFVNNIMIRAAQTLSRIYFKSTLGKIKQQRKYYILEYSLSFQAFLCEFLIFRSICQSNQEKTP